MSDQNVSVALETAAGEVLETMFFTSAMDEPVEAAPGDPSVRVRLQFQGTVPGVFAIELPLTAAQTIAADFLGGSAEEFSQGQVEQVVCEMANMICGATLSKLDAETKFDLSSPQPEQAGKPSACSAVCQVLYLPDGPLTLSLDMGGTN